MKCPHCGQDAEPDEVEVILFDEENTIEISVTVDGYRCKCGKPLLPEEKEILIIETFSSKERVASFNSSSN